MYLCVAVCMHVCARLCVCICKCVCLCVCVCVGAFNTPSYIIGLYFVCFSNSFSLPLSLSLSLSLFLSVSISLFVSAGLSLRLFPHVLCSAGPTQSVIIPPPPAGSLSHYTVLVVTHGQFM